jgi:hypothetical protein
LERADWAGVVRLRRGEKKRAESRVWVRIGAEMGMGAEGFWNDVVVEKGRGMSSPALYSI